MWLLIGAIAFAAAGSFRRELQTGSLELLLVTPVREHQLITGRLWGLFSHFLPAVLVWTVFRYMQSVLSRPTGGLVDDVVTLYSTLLALPAIGFALSFCRVNLIAAFLLCLVGGVFVPGWLADFVDGRTRWFGHRVDYSTLVFVGVQLAVAIMAARHLRMRLAERRFLPQPAT
jgi:ABC-type Na+ efflux pump permease subunit